MVLFVSMVGLAFGANFVWVVAAVLGGAYILRREHKLEKSRQLVEARNDNSAYWKGPTKK